MEVRAVDSVLYKVSNLNRAIEFYRDTLGLPLESTFRGAWAELTAEQLAIALGRPEADRSSPGPGTGAEVALAVSDVKAAVEDLRAKGVSILREAGEAPVCHMALVADPDGNRIWLHQRKDGTTG